MKAEVIPQQGEASRFQRQIAPIVSVIIPTYNSARFLPEALESVFSQNYAAYEIIVVDDGSTDDTCEVLEPYKRRIRYVYRKNAGSAAARNTGLDLAQGRYIVFLDADDLFLPGKLRQQAAYLELRPDLGYVHSGWDVIDQSGSILRIETPWKEASRLELDQLLQYKTVRLGPIMFRRLWLESVGGLDPHLRQSHDVDLLLRLALAGCRGEWIYRSTVCYREHSGSTIRKDAATQIKCVLAVLDKFFALPNVPADIQADREKTYYYTTLWLAWHLFRSDRLEEIASVLELNLSLEFHVAPDSQIRKVLDWLHHFAMWSEKEGISLARLPDAWGQFATAAGNKVDQWPTVDRFARWWLGRKWTGKTNPSEQPYDSWKLFSRAVDHELKQDHVFAEVAIEWHTEIWSRYRERQYDAAVACLHEMEALTDGRFIELVRFSAACEPRPPTSSELSQLWRDASSIGLLSDMDELSFLGLIESMRRPDVSVIIPSYNRSDRVGDAIESVLAQTFDNYEIVVVDDGSTDETKVALRTFRGLIRYIYQENQGVSAARNEGLRRALGEYILFLDSDDTLLPKKLATQLARMKEEPELDVLHSGWQVVDSTGQTVQVVEPWHYAPELNLATWLTWKPVFLGSMLFRRQCLAEANGFNRELRQAEDTDLMLRLALSSCRMTWLEEATVHYRQHETNIMHNAQEQAESLSRVMDDFFSRTDLPRNIRHMEPSVRYYTDMWLVWQLYTQGPAAEIAEYLRRTLSYLTNDTPSLILQRWLIHMIRHAHNDRIRIRRLNDLFVYFRIALGSALVDWDAMEVFLDYWLQDWLEDWLRSVDHHIEDASRLWSLAHSALALERDGHVEAAGQWLKWWVTVWQYYMQGDVARATANLKGFGKLSCEQVVSLAQASVLWKPNDISLSKIADFWRGAQVVNIVPLSKRRAVAGVYLTYFGQALLGRHWQLAWNGLTRATSQGIGGQALRSWARFFYTAGTYFLNRERWRDREAR